MTDLQQTVEITSDRRILPDMPVPEDIPANTTHVRIVISPLPKGMPLQSIKHPAGVFANSKTFSADPVELQRAMRDEW